MTVRSRRIPIVLVDPADALRIDASMLPADTLRIDASMLPADTLRIDASMLDD